MAYTTINKSTAHFNTNLYTGNNSNTAHTGIGFQPDFVWLKVRNASGAHYLFDAVRGANKDINSSDTSAEYTATQNLMSFDSDGYTVGTSNSVNTNGETMVGWNWKANGAGSSNSDGSITSTVSVNTTGGFSIVSYAGTGSTATIGHGLGVAPKMIIIKNRSQSNGWITGHYKMGWTKYIELNSTSAKSDLNTIFNDTAPTSTVFTVGTEAAVNNNGNNFIAYCFAEKQGYSKFGEYTGNGDANGQFIYTGFKPALVMCKRTDGGTQNWCIMDNKRGFNPDVQQLHPNTSGVETLGSGDTLDLLSNGFKLRANDGDKNGSGEIFIYMAIGQSIVGSNNVPAVAR